MKRTAALIAALMAGALFYAQVLFAEPPKEITVSAAISLKNAFEELGKLYEGKNRGVKALFNFGASGDLAGQIEGGAPVDVFASAAQKDMDALEKKGLILRGSRMNAAGNTVVLVVPSHTAPPIKSFGDLKLNSVKRIAAGDPRTVPAGRYAEEVFQHYGILGSIKNKIVFAGNVRQVLDYVARGEVDAGVVYSTDAATRMKEVRIAATAPEGSHKPVEYPIAIVRGTKNEKAAKDFLMLVTSPEGKRILEKYGFRTSE
ncbi:MAG TPA: molybdate ABC transporter substrate-binding protein [Dissulfurispiraceae bacterium]